ncbi:MAG: porin [Alphaproteobacteria bacterium]|nr:porin [Alphaproteobacteria bacterium]
MNKLLMGTAVAALFVTPAMAGPVAVTVGGYYNSVVYSQDADEFETRDLGVHNDAEIIFKGKGKTKNGIEVGFQVQLEAEGAGESDHIDENYVYAKGDFGKVEIGAENNAAYKQQVSAPKFLGWKTYDNNFETWRKVSSFDKPLMDGVEGDALKINYYSPKVNGFQISYSVTPDARDTSGDTALYLDNGELDSDGDVARKGSSTALGLKYSGKIAGMKVKASYGINELDEDTGVDPREDTAMGLSVSSGAITVGGTMFTKDANGAETDILHYAIAYKLSKATQVGLMMHNQEAPDGDETNIMVVGGSTKIGSGAKLTYSYETVEDDNPEKGDSTFMGVGLLLKF